MSTTTDQPSGSAMQGLAWTIGLSIALFLGAFDLPVLGAIAGVGVFIAVAVQNIPLLVGAYAGGAAAQG